MSTFAEILQPVPGELPGDTQRRARDAFPRKLAASRFGLCSPSEIATAESAIVIGIATWSQYDLHLLDYLDSVLEETAGETLFIVIDVDAFPLDELHQHLPHDPRPLGTPLVAYWEAGRFVESACGYAGRQLIYRELGLNVAEAEQFVAQRHSPTAA
jgi:hypothetical protein